MSEFESPVLDNHLHLDPEHGRGIEAVKEFARTGGTHLLVVNKPSWHLGDLPTGRDSFEGVFETTIEAVREATEELPGRAWPVLGVHPALVSQLVEAGSTPEEAAAVMRMGIDLAAEYVGSGRALALKSGRPHYEVSEETWEASNDVLRHALARGAERDCVVQLHTESSEDLTEITDWAERAASRARGS